jgi:hypothetical protein
VSSTDLLVYYYTTLAEAKAILIYDGIPSLKLHPTLQIKRYNKNEDFFDDDDDMALSPSRMPRKKLLKRKSADIFLDNDNNINPWEYEDNITGGGGDNDADDDADNLRALNRINKTLHEIQENDSFGRRGGIIVSMKGPQHIKLGDPSLELMNPLAPSREAVMCLSLPASMLWSLKLVVVDKNYDIVEEGGEYNDDDADDDSMQQHSGIDGSTTTSEKVNNDDDAHFSASNHHRESLINTNKAVENDGKGDDLWSIIVNEKDDVESGVARAINSNIGSDNDDNGGGGGRNTSGGKQQGGSPVEHLRLLPVEVLEAMGIFKPSQRGGRFSLGSMRGSFGNGKSFMSFNNSFDSGSMQQEGGGGGGLDSSTLKTPSKSFFKQTTAGRKDIGVHLSSDRILRVYQVPVCDILHAHTHDGIYIYYVYFILFF